MLAFSPSLAKLDTLNSHRSTLESFGKKVEEKAKALRSAELLFGAKKAEWDGMSELAGELRANSDEVIVLCEGMAEALVRAVISTCTVGHRETNEIKVTPISSNLHLESLKNLGARLKGRRVSLLVLVQGLPSDRMVWCFRILLDALSQARHPDEVKRRVVVATGQPASPWERWAQGSSYRTVSYPHRCSGRYLFFSEPTALLLHLLGLPAWSYVEGGRSFFRQYDKMAETNDPVFAYAALREVQLAEHHRETLVLADESYIHFGRWWRVLTEESRKLFCEESHDGVLWFGSVMKEGASAGRLHWVTEIALEANVEVDVNLKEGDRDTPPLSYPEHTDWEAMETSYRQASSKEREGPGYSQPTVRISLRRRDPFCVGSLFAFFESVVCASHKLAETGDSFALLTPHVIGSSGVRA